MTKNAYLRSAWNQLDFAIVCVSILVLAAESIPELRPLRTLRIFRVLRPLRLISRIEGMKLIVSSLVKALPAVGNVFLVVLAVQSVFAILGMQLFMGTLASCTDPNILTREDCHETVRRALRGGSSGGGEFNGEQSTRWANPPLGSFDSFGEAMRLLFIMGSGDEWEAPMFMTMAATSPGHAPVRNDYSPAAFFSIAWMFIGSFFALNLFVGVICDSFDRIKKESDGQSATMTQEQQQWVKTMQALAKQQPTKGRRVPSNICQRLLYDIMTSQAFDAVITVVIVANIGLMACNFWQIEKQPFAQSAFNLGMRVFTNIYYGEFVLKVLALGPMSYFADGWNRFDFFLVATAGVDDFLAVDVAAVVPLPPFLLRVLRVFRILRILRLLKSARGLRDLIVTTILSFPSLLNVSSLLSLVVFIYAVLGVHLFTFLTHQENIDDGRNFDTVANACLLLFQALTGDAWSGLMTDAMLSAETGLCEVAAGSCGSAIAIPYFVSFELIGSFVLLNLVVAVILENFSSLGSLNPDLVSPADVEAFKESWVEFDPDADNYIPASDLPELVLCLPPPMGLKGIGDERAAIKLCLKLSMTQYEGRVAFQEVLNALTRRPFLEKGDIDANALNALETPAAPPPPPLPLSLKDAVVKPSGAGAFAKAMPSVRRVFALQVIAKHAAAVTALRRRAEGTIMGQGTPRTIAKKAVGVASSTRAMAMRAAGAVANSQPSSCRVLRSNARVRRSSNPLQA